MVIPGCESNCTLYKFKEILRDVIPSDGELHYDKRSLRDPIEKGEIKVPKAITLPILNAIKREEKSRNILQ